MKVSLRHFGLIVFLCLVIMLGSFIIQPITLPVYADEFDRFADAVLGQPDFTSSFDDIHRPSATNLLLPGGVAVDQQTGRLYVADSNNHRVLSWPDAATFTNQQAADMVIGQPDFVSNQPNQNQSEPDAETLNGPISVAVDSASNLYVTDYVNNRVLMYESPTENDVTADLVFGQSDFSGSSLGGGPEKLHHPFGIGIDPAGNLYIADSENHRVLQYDTPLTTDTLPDRVFGQPDFDSDIPNNGGISAASLYSPIDLALDTTGRLYVADIGNDRILIYHDPLSTDTIADEVLGQLNFTSVVRSDPGPDSIAVPHHVDVDRYGNVYTLEINRDRIMVFENPLQNDKVADWVIGQPDFTTIERYDRDTSAATLSEPFAMSVDANNNLFVADTYNSRVLRYDTVVPHPVPEITAVSPATIPVGSESLLLTVTGRSFAADTVLFWDDMPLETTFVDYTEVTATIDAAYLRETGTANVTIRNPAPGGQQSAPWTITIDTATAPTPTSTPVVPTPPAVTQTVFLPAIIR